MTEKRTQLSKETTTQSFLPLQRSSRKQLNQTMKLSLSTSVSLLLMVMTRNSVQAFMTHPLSTTTSSTTTSSASNPLLSKRRILESASSFVPTCRAVSGTRLSMSVDDIVTGFAGKPASSPEEDFELTIRIIKAFNEKEGETAVIEPGKPGTDGKASTGKPPRPDPETEES